MFPSSQYVAFTQATTLTDPAVTADVSSVTMASPEYRVPLSFHFPHEHLVPSETEISVGWHDDGRPSVLDSPSSPVSSASPEPVVASGSGSSSGSASASAGGSSPLTPTPATPPELAQTQAAKAGQLALLIRSHSQGWARSFELHRDWPHPGLLADDEVLVRNVCMGLNPVDFKSLIYRFGIESFPCVLGRDIYGVVERVGAAVRHVAEGDRVWTCADSRDGVRAGAYQAWSVCKGFTLGKLPSHSQGRSGDGRAGCTDEEAATIGTGLVTAGVALHWFFNLPKAEASGGEPLARSSTVHSRSGSQATRRQAHGGETPHAPHPGTHRRPQQWLLIYGGGAVTGIYAAQLAHLSGLKVLSVASPQNFDYLTSIGVDACVDRHLPSDKILEEIAAITTDGDLAYALDCVGSATATLCERALAESQGGGDASAQLICLAGNPKRTRDRSDDGDEDRGKAATTAGSNATKGAKSAHQDDDDDATAQTQDPSQTRRRHRQRRDVQVPRISFSTTFYSDTTWTTQFLDYTSHLFATGALRPVQPVVLPDGLASVRKGLESLRDGSAPRAKKLVVRLHDTPDADVTNLGQKEELGWNGCV
ncbi:unnamed protein product [Parajaminaea phylloscopi]